jgi:hypothetical protein
MGVRWQPAAEDATAQIDRRADSGRLAVAEART